ncbi:MAG: TIGR02281 family clan AA aspartic protease [Novosphingobium sp.]
MYRLIFLAVGSAIAMFVAAQLVLSPRQVAADQASGKSTVNAMAASARHSDNSEETEIARDATGQFHLTAQVNGRDARFLVDTGADLVALTVDDAKDLGVDFDPDSFEPIGRSASGVARGAVVKLDRFQVGEEEFRDVDAIVLEGLETNLLGQSLLRRLGKVEMRGDRMVLRHS